MGKEVQTASWLGAPVKKILELAPTASSHYSAELGPQRWSSGPCPAGQ